MRTIFFLALLAVLLSATTLQAQPVTNLVVNGSFESPSVSGVGTFRTIPGWTTTFGPGIEIQRRVAGNPFAGDQHVELDSSGNSGMAQDFPTMPGLAYLLTFAYSPRPDISADSNGIDVLFDGKPRTNITATGLSP